MNSVSKILIFRVVFFSINNFESNHIVSVVSSNGQIVWLKFYWLTQYWHNAKPSRYTVLSFGWTISLTWNNLLILILFFAQDLTWSVSKVQRKLQSGDVITCNPNKMSKNYGMYSVCRRLKLKSGEVLRQFFFCTSCNVVLAVNLATHYNKLKRHYEACAGIKKKSIPRGSEWVLSCFQNIYITHIYFQEHQFKLPKKTSVI